MHSGQIKGGKKYYEKIDAYFSTQEGFRGRLCPPPREVKEDRLRLNGLFVERRASSTDTLNVTNRDKNKQIYIDFVSASLISMQLIEYTYGYSALNLHLF